MDEFLMSADLSNVQPALGAKPVESVIFVWFTPTSNPWTWKLSSNVLYSNIARNVAGKSSRRDIGPLLDLQRNKMPRCSL